MLNASRVVQGSRRVSPVHYFSVATVDKDAVVTWTRRHIGPVTSLVERNGTRAITLRVGPAGMTLPYLLGMEVSRVQESGTV